MRFWGRVISDYLRQTNSLSSSVLFSKEKNKGVTGSRCLLLRTCIIRTYVHRYEKIPALSAVPLLDVKHYLLDDCDRGQYAASATHTHTHMYTEREQYIIRIMHDNLLLDSLSGLRLLCLCVRMN